MRHLFMVILAVFEIMACSQVNAAVTCSPHKEAGWVSSIDVIDGTKPLGRVPRVRRGNDVFTLAAVDGLCVGDHVENPDNSNQRITLHLISEDKPIRPGENFSIDPLTYSDWLTKNLERFNALLESALVPDTYYKPGRSRTGDCPFSPPQDPPIGISVVADWGPLILTWPCNPPNSVPFVAYIGSDRAPVKAGMLWENYLRVDVANLCNKSCDVHVFDGAQNGILFGFLIKVVKSVDAKAPEYLLRSGTDPWARAALGAYLLQQDGRGEWKNPALSLLAAEACRVPVAARLTARALGTADMTRVCK